MTGRAEKHDVYIILGEDGRARVVPDIAIVDSRSRQVRVLNLTGTPWTMSGSLVEGKESEIKGHTETQTVPLASNAPKVSWYEVKRSDTERNAFIYALGRSAPGMILDP